MAKASLFHHENLSELERFLQKRVLKGEAGAPEVRDYVKAKARADIMRRIATVGNEAPGAASQKMLEHADDERYAAMIPATRDEVPETSLTHANALWQRLKNSKIRG